MTTSFNIPDFMPAAPEIFLLTMACVVLVADLFISDENRVATYMLAQLSLLGTLLLTLFGAPAETVTTFSGTYINDQMATVLKTVIYIVTGFVFLYSRGYLEDRDIHKGEYYVLGLFGVLGMMIMVSAHNFLTIYLGLELLSLSLYAMVAFHRESMQASEAAMKYFILGAIASGMLLYGMSMIYGATGTLDIGEMTGRVAARGASDIVLVFGLVFVVVGLAFKLGAVPFHMWIPDVYHGSPTSVTMYISSAPKIAGFAIVMRLLADGFAGLHEGGWQGMLIILAVLSLGVGNVIALAQTNLKRMLAYSTISHVGFLLLGILAGTKAGYSSAMFYIITYAATAMAGFALVVILSRRGFEADELADLKGLSRRSPWLAFMMLILMFSMAGVPPTVGFYAKLLVLQAVVDIDLVWLAAVAVGFSIVGAFYYLRVVKLMYFDEPQDDRPVEVSAEVNIVFSINALAVLVVGLFPGALIALCGAVLA